MKLAYRFDGLNDYIARYQNAPKVSQDLIEKNVRSLGKVLAAKMRQVLEVVKYTGEMERTISSEVAFAGTRWTLKVGSTSKHAEFVRYGTRPHWVPIAPLKRWARWKLGDENAAYGIQKLIAHQGTSSYIERRGLGDGNGGYDYPARTLARGDVQTGLARTAKRIGANIEVYLESGKIETTTEGES